MASGVKKCFKRFLKRTGIRRGLLAGVLVLMVVDVLWVGAAAPSKYLYVDQHYNKPLFATYFKTTLFSIYLTAFIFWRPWQRLALRGCSKKQSPNIVSCQPNDINSIPETTNLLSSDKSHDVESPADQSDSSVTVSSEITQQSINVSPGCHGNKAEEGFVKFPTSKYGTCPINPELKVCSLGPPEYEPLGCYDDSSDDERIPTKPLSPCDDRCCKVRFKPTVEVRAVPQTGGLRRKLFRKSPAKEKWRKPQLLPVWKVAVLALIFGIIWFFANYLYSVALDWTSVGSVNTLSATSGVFVMILAAFPCLSVTDGDKISLSRCLVTFVSVGGAVLVSLSPSGAEESSEQAFKLGALLALGGAVLYSIYLVLLRRVVTDHEALDIPMFFGFVGLFDGIILAPLLVIWHFTGVELFEAPPTAYHWTLLLVNGFIGTVLSELLWLWGVFLTSPLMGTLALSLVTPISIGYSIAMGQAVFSWMFLCGALLIMFSFVMVTVLDHFGAWDPLWAGIRTLFLKARDFRHHREFRALSPNSKALMINQQLSPQSSCTDYFVPNNF